MGNVRDLGVNRAHMPVGQCRRKPNRSLQGWQIMVSKGSRTKVVSVCRLTLNGERFYPWHSSEKLEVQFSKTFVHCHLPDGTVLKKIHGGRRGGNFEGVESGDVYRISD